MRKHDVRKWLHAILDLLPVILIPVFMIYSHRHTIDSGSIQVPQNQVVDFNQIQPLLNDVNQFYVNDVSDFVFNDDTGSFVVNVNSGNVNSYPSRISISTEHTYYVCLRAYSNSVNSRFSLNNYSSVNLTTSYSRLGLLISNYDVVYFTLVGDENSHIEFTDVMCFDLTQMFGVGNEPTIQQFNQWFSDDYYDYTLSHKELLKNTSTITYDDTDIMSQFTYQLYNSVDKYFNMGNVFHLNEVYDWFNLNIFNGQAPIYIYIVYQIVLYELIMDLLMLLYALFMWFIDMIEKLMEKPLNSVK